MIVPYLRGYGTTHFLASDLQQLPPQAELGWWYQYYFATERGRAGYERYRHDFNKLIWKSASPKWNFADATYERTAISFDNPDHVAIVIHNYRWRLGLAKGEPRYDDLERNHPSAAISMVPRRMDNPTRGNIPRSMRTGSSRASATTCPKKHRMRLPRP